MRKTLLAIAVLAAGGLTASAQTAGPGCFHVEQGTPAIRWNSCTGETWLLLRMAVTDKDGKPDGSQWGWFPVIVSKAPATSTLN